jgi:xanthine dehydrogenase accessory factor
MPVSHCGKFMTSSGRRRGACSAAGGIVAMTGRSSSDRAPARKMPEVEVYGPAAPSGRKPAAIPRRIRLVRRLGRPKIPAGRGASAMAGTERTDLLDLMTALRARREPYALATVVETAGSASAQPGAKALIARDGTLLTGWVGGGCAESAVRETALDCLQSGEPRVIALDLNDEVLGTGMPCGGSMRVFIEPVLPRPTLWILGHGRVAEVLSRFAATLGFRIVVNDTPPPDPTRFPDAEEIIGDDYDYARLAPETGDAVVIATQHKGDHLSAARALRSPAGYIAIIASRKRSGLVLDYLREQGFGEAELARIRAPAGLDLGARTPEEIALSVVSEIVMLRRGGSGGPLRIAAAGRGEARAAPVRQHADAPA